MRKAAIGIGSNHDLKKTMHVRKNWCQVISRF